MKKLLLKSIDIFLILASVGLFLWLFNKNFPVGGQLEVKAVLGFDRPMISRLGPDPRLKVEDGYQVVLDNPVYFDLRSPRWFNQARVELVYKEFGRELENMAGKVGADWQYDSRQAIAVIELEDGWKKAIFDFDLNSMYAEKNVRRFLISTKGEIREELYIKSIDIILKR